MLTKEKKQHLDQVAKAAASLIITKRVESVVTDKSAKRSMEFNAPNVITKRAENDDEFRFNRLFKSLLHGTDSKEMELVTKAMSTNDDSLGGYLVPPTQSSEIIDFLGAKAVIRNLGCDILPMTTGQLPVPRVSNGVSTSYLGENVTGTTDDVDLGQVVLHARSLVAFVPTSNQLLQDSASTERVIRNTIARSLGIAETEAFLQFTGGVKPLGLLRLPNRIQQTAVTLATLVLDDITDIITAVENAESEVTGFITTPAVMGALQKLKGDDGHPILSTSTFDPNGMRRLLNIPIAVTTNCKLGTTNYLVAADFAGEVVIGQRASLEFAVSEHVQFMKTQTVIRAIMRHDIVARHEEAVGTLAIAA